MNISILMLCLIICFIHAADDVSEIPSVIYAIAPATEYGVIAAILAAQKSDRLYIAYDGYVTIWDMAQEPKREKQLCHRKVSFMQLNRDETRLFSGSHNGLVKVWDVNNGEPLHKIDVDSKLQDLLYADDHLYVDGERAIKVFSVKDDVCALIGSYPAMDRLYNFKFHNDHLYYTDGSQVIHMRDRHNMRYPIICHTPGGKFEMDEQHLFFAELSFNEPPVKVFKRADKRFEKQTKLKGHMHAILKLECIKGENILCSASYDKTIKLWDTKTFALLVTLTCKDTPWNTTISKNAIYARYPDGNIEKWKLSDIAVLQLKMLQK